jgi:hypothetical protein
MATTPPVEITKDEALAAVRAGAWTGDPDPASATCGHPGCTDHPGEGSKIVHCAMSFTGADWSLAAVERAIDLATRIAWVDGFAGHDLSVESEGRQFYFAVKRPSTVGRDA